MIKFELLTKKLNDLKNKDMEKNSKIQKLMKDNK